MSDKIIRSYYLITGLFNLAASLIWGVDTLFKLHAGLDIFQVMLTNAAFTFGMVVFEIPTGVVADTLGRRVSLILCIVTLLVSTLLYLATAVWHWGFWSFMGTSVLLGLGYTFYTGAVDAWLVDALKATGYTGGMEPIFARGQMVFGAAMLLGTLGGGFLGQIDLAVPYLVRSATFLPLLAVAWVAMPELGYTPRALEWRRVPTELKRVFVEGLTFGLHHKVVRPVMLASLVGMSFMIFGFYSWQRYFLDLLGREFVWVSGAVAAVVSLAMIVGNALVGRVSRVIRTRTGVLAGAVGVEVVAVIGAAVSGFLLPRPAAFFGALGCYLLYAVALGVSGPVKQGYLNAHIPSAQRATIISLDSLFADLGGVLGQSGWGYLAKKRSIGEAWLYSGFTLILAVPLYFVARRNDKTLDSFETDRQTPSVS